MDIKNLRKAELQIAGTSTLRRRLSSFNDLARELHESPNPERQETVERVDAAILIIKAELARRGRHPIALAGQ